MNRRPRYLLNRSAGRACDDTGCRRSCISCSGRASDDDGRHLDHACEPLRSAGSTDDEDQVPLRFKIAAFGYRPHVRSASACCHKRLISASPVAAPAPNTSFRDEYFAADHAQSSRADDFTSCRKMRASQFCEGWSTLESLTALCHPSGRPSWSAAAPVRSHLSG